MWVNPKKASLPIREVDLEAATANAFPEFACRMLCVKLESPQREFWVAPTTSNGRSFFNACRKRAPADSVPLAPLIDPTTAFRRRRRRIEI